MLGEWLQTLSQPATQPPRQAGRQQAVRTNDVTHSGTMVGTFAPRCCDVLLPRHAVSEATKRLLNIAPTTANNDANNDNDNDEKSSEWKKCERAATTG